MRSRSHQGRVFVRWDNTQAVPSVELDRKGVETWSRVSIGIDKCHREELTEGGGNRWSIRKPLGKERAPTPGLSRDNLAGRDGDKRCSRRQAQVSRGAWPMTQMSQATSGSLNSSTSHVYRRQSAGLPAASSLRLFVSHSSSHLACFHIKARVFSLKSLQEVDATWRSTWFIPWFQIPSGRGKEEPPVTPPPNAQMRWGNGLKALQFCQLSERKAALSPVLVQPTFCLSCLPFS